MRHHGRLVTTPILTAQLIIDDELAYQAALRSMDARLKGQRATASAATEAAHGETE